MILFTCNYRLGSLIYRDGTQINGCFSKKALSGGMTVFFFLLEHKIHNYASFFVTDQAGHCTGFQLYLNNIFFI